MKQLWRQIRIPMIIGILTPWLFLQFGITVLSRYRGQTVMMPPVQTEPAVQTKPAVSTDVPIPVLFRSGEKTIEMDMDAYLVGVVLAEMPASFEEEALKAQSVVARTYARKAYVTGGKHGDGSVCGQSSCCQGYTGEQDYLSSGGTAESVKKVRSAVQSTSGMVLTYDGELIEATYFSCSGGRTEDAVAVWGTDFPYLQAVDSPGEENAAHYTDTQQFSADAFAAALGLSMTGNPASWLGPVTYTEGGGVHTMVIGGETFTGTQLRSLLGLRSASFSMTVQGSGITVTTKGYGHRVGMSQYGANAMALSGNIWEEILAHYYQGAVISMLS